MFSQKGLRRHDVRNWNERDVSRWLKEKGFRKILRHFRDNKVDGKTLLQVTGQYLDEHGVVTQSSRDKLLAAIHELKLFGGPLPEEKHFRLSVPGTDDRALCGQHKKWSLPARLPDMQHFMQEVVPDLSGQASPTPELKRSSSWKGLDTSDVPVRKTPLEVLQEQTEKRNSLGEQHIDTGEVQVHTKGLGDECKTIEVTSQTTSKELVRMILEQTDAVPKDPNLFYIAVEIGIKKKDSNLPISQMMVLANDARPLQIRSRQLSGEAKFHLKMRNGGLVRVHAGVLSPGVTYKSMRIARQTTADEVIKMLLSSYGCDEHVEDFVLVESSTDSSVGRVLEQNECPLLVQSQWTAVEQNVFTLTRYECKVISQSNGTERKSKVQDAVFDAPSNKSHTLQEDCLKEEAERRMNQGKRYAQEKSQQTDSPFSEMEERESIEEIRKRRTSIEALDLQASSHQTRKVSQIDKFRHKFHEFHRKTTADESVICGESSKKRKVSQIDRFRTKFLAYYSGKIEGPESTNSLNQGVDRDEHVTIDESTRPKNLSSSDGEGLSHFSSSLPTLLAANSAINDFSHESAKGENREADVDVTSSVRSQLNLATILQHSKLFAVSLAREPGEDWGLELVHVTKTGSLISQKENGQSEEEKVVYVLHNGNGQNSILSNPDFHSKVFTPSSTSTPLSGLSSGSSELEMSSILCCSSRSSADLDSSLDDMRHMVHKQNLKRRIRVSVGSTSDQLSPADASPLLSRPSSTSLLRPTNPAPQRSSSALAQWRTEGSPQPRPGVRIVGMTGGGVAARTGELEVGDLIVEINGSYVLHSPLELVISAMQSSLTVTLVVSRTRPPKPKSQEKDKITSCQEDIKTLTVQIQDLVTKVSEMQSDITQKDDKIRSLKKLVKKHKEGKSKIYETVQVLV